MSTYRPFVVKLEIANGRRVSQCPVLQEAFAALGSENKPRLDKAILHHGERKSVYHACIFVREWERNASLYAVPCVYLLHPNESDSLPYTAFFPPSLCLDLPYDLCCSDEALHGSRGLLAIPISFPMGFIPVDRLLSSH